MKILFVCLGNICRSPMAETLLRKKTQDLSLDWEIDSAGMMGFLVGMAPDLRGQEVMKKNGLDISHLRSRRVTHDDIDYFDWIIAMDGGNYKDLLDLANESNKNKIIQFSKIDTGETIHIPDPVLEEYSAFERTYHLLDECLDNWLKKQGVIHQ